MCAGCGPDAGCGTYARVGRGGWHHRRMAFQEIVSDLVANVAQVQVQVGQQVEIGQELVLLESMKMEIPVLSEVAGTVAAVRVAPGDVVQEGEILVVLS